MMKIEKALFQGAFFYGNKFGKTKINSYICIRERYPHQSRLGNSSNFHEKPRLLSFSDGGPCSVRKSKDRRITKEGEYSNPVYRSFIALFDVVFYNGGEVLFKLHHLF